jgi:hypothetical protein
LIIDRALSLFLYSRFFSNIIFFLFLFDFEQSGHLTTMQEIPLAALLVPVTFWGGHEPRNILAAAIFLLLLFVAYCCVLRICYSYCVLCVSSMASRSLFTPQVSLLKASLLKPRLHGLLVVRHDHRLRDSWLFVVFLVLIYRDKLTNRFELLNHKQIQSCSNKCQP